MISTPEDELALCSVCGTIHVSDTGFADNRKCRNCGEENVFSIVEMRDIVNDWLKLKEDWDMLLNDMDDGK